MALRLQPVKDKIIVEDINEAETRGGLVLPENADINTVCCGVVLAVGSGFPITDKLYHFLPFKEGDKVVYRKSAGHKFLFDARRLRALHEGEILATVK